MSHARLRVELPPGQWKADVTYEFPSTTVHLQNSVVANGDTVEVVSLSDNPCIDCFRAIVSHSAIDASSIVHRSEQEIILQLETSLSPVLMAANRAGAPLSYPIELIDGHALIDIIGTHERIKRFGTQMTEAEINFDTLSLQKGRESKQVLTHRQREFLHAALDLGYYETPRQCTLTEVATEMDVAKSTCCSILHRAEQAIIEDFVTRYSPPNNTKSTRDLRA